MLHKKSYLAGIIDGEGSFTAYRIQKKPKKTGKGFYGGISKAVIISNTNLPMMQQCKTAIEEIIGEPINIHTCSRLTISGKTVYGLYIQGGERLRKFLPKIIPYLVAKKKQAQVLLRLLQRERYSPTTDEELVLVTILRELNDRRTRVESVTTNTPYLRTLRKKIESELWGNPKRG